MFEKLIAAKLVVFDFDGVFTDNKVYVDSNGNETVSCWRSDGLGLRLLREIDFPSLILSTETNIVVSKRAQKLEIEAIQGIENKEKEIKSIAQRFKINLQEIIFVGNDLNDLEVLKLVGIPIIVKDAYHALHKFKFFKTRTEGGKGAVREVCELIYNAKK